MLPEDKKIDIVAIIDFTVEITRELQSTGAERRVAQNPDELLFAHHDVWVAQATPSIQDYLQTEINDQLSVIPLGFNTGSFEGTLAIFAVGLSAYEFVTRYPNFVAGLDLIRRQMKSLIERGTQASLQELAPDERWSVLAKVEIRMCVPPPGDTASRTPSSETEQTRDTSIDWGILLLVFVIGLLVGGTVSSRNGDDGQSIETLQLIQRYDFESTVPENMSENAHTDELSLADVGRNDQSALNLNLSLPPFAGDSDIGGFHVDLLESVKVQAIGAFVLLPEGVDDPSKPVLTRFEIPLTTGSYL